MVMCNVKCNIAGREESEYNKKNDDDKSCDKINNYVNAMIRFFQLY